MAGPKRRTSVAGSKSLLSKQLASIADTLAKASQRRDEEVRRARERQTIRSEVSSVPVTFVMAPAPTSRIEGSVDEQCCEDYVDGRYAGVHEEEVSTEVEEQNHPFEKMTTKSCERREAGVNTASQEVALVTQKDLNCDEELLTHSTSSITVNEDRRHALDVTFKRLMAEMRDYEAEEARQEEAKQVTDQQRQFEQAKKAALRLNEHNKVSYRSGSDSRPDELAPQYGTADRTTCNTSTSSAQAGEVPPLEDDLRALRSELHNLRDSSHEPEAQKYEDDEGKDLSHLLAQFDKMSSGVHIESTSHRDNPLRDNNPRKMLAELASLSTLSVTNTMSLAAPAHEDEEDEDLNVLRARLESLRSFDDGCPSLTPTSSAANSTKISKSAPAHTDPELLPYIIALLLETSGCPWEHVQSWIRSLFNPKPNPSPPTTQQGQQAAVLRAEARLQSVITSVLGAEQIRREREEQTELQRRIIVSNLAAAADGADVERPFWGHRWDIVDISLLPVRDPLKRTQTAYVDFVSREAAVRASWVSGQVYGLIFEVKLAVPVPVPVPVPVLVPVEE